MNYIFFKSITWRLLFIMVLSFLAGCSDENSNLLPGLSVEQGETIATFPGDTVLVRGTASNYAGLASITLVVDTWDVEKVFDLSKRKPTVFNYEYQLIVPKTAVFDEHLQIAVSDVNGKKSERTVRLQYLPDTQTPELKTQLPGSIAVDFDPEAGTGRWDATLLVADDRELKDINLQIPDLELDVTETLAGRNGQFNKSIDFNTPGEYPVTITITDGSDNKIVVQIVVVVMLKEEEDPIADYPQMFVVNAGENPDDYVNGYYRYMDRTGAYQYNGRYYAPEDQTPIFFVPTKSVDHDLFGVSPYVNSKLLNKNGYVEPILLPKKGYYTIYIDLQSHSYSISEYPVPTETYTGYLIASGTGFTVGDWGYSGEMRLVDSGNPYRKEVEMELVEGYIGDFQYYFADIITWSPVFRSDPEGNWWFAAASGSVIKFQTDYAGKVMVTFDTAELWGTIKKVAQ